jgi:hypothetical protein
MEGLPKIMVIELPGIYRKQGPGRFSLMNTIKSGMNPICLFSKLYPLPAVNNPVLTDQLPNVRTVG